MILVYHKVAPDSPSEWWVPADAFARQMNELAAYDVVTLDDYDPGNPRHAVITFDGVYANVLEYAAPIMQAHGYPFELFVIGDWLGRENTFDQHVEPPCWFADADQLAQMVAMGGRVQWHTRTHRRLEGLPAADLAHEIAPDPALVARFGAPHMGWFAYPHGGHDGPAADETRRHFRGALSCVQGDGADPYRRNRVIVEKHTRLCESRVSLVVANYNYGHLLDEALDSVRRQSVMPDELLLIDDASSDDSASVYARRRDVAHEAPSAVPDDAPFEAGRFRLVRNAENLGTVETFRRAVAMTTGDYVVFLGADNRFRCDAVERGKAALDGDPGAVVAYSDALLFGARAGVLAAQVGAVQIGADPFEGTPVFRWDFPDPTPERVAAIARHNFIHGSSMYRRSAYDAVGGYRETGGPEDQNLFTRMLAAGGGCVRVPHATLEYRQHSTSQRNALMQREQEVAHLRGRLAKQAGRIEALETRVRELEGGG